MRLNPHQSIVSIQKLCSLKFEAYPVISPNWWYVYCWHLSSFVYNNVPHISMERQWIGVRRYSAVPEV